MLEKTLEADGSTTIRIFFLINLNAFSSSMTFNLASNTENDDCFRDNTKTNAFKPIL